MTLGRHVAALTSALVLAAGAGCAGGQDGATFRPAIGSDGAYCKTYRAWKVYELDHGEAFDQPNPSALRRYWNAYLVSEETMLQQAPPAIREAVAVKVSFIRTRLTPAMEAYGFDLRRMHREATPAEQAALFVGPPAVVEHAQARQYAYEDSACGTQPSPPAAGVEFEAGASSESYCRALAGFDGVLDVVATSGFDPRVLQNVATGDRFAETLRRLEDAAPAEIAADVQADAEWFRGRWGDVVERYGYDLRRIYLDATPEDLAVFNRTHPDVVDHVAREVAYENQICG